MTPTIQTRHGRYFDFASPETSVIDIDDIASALSKMCRFTGHSLDFYSVAEHSVRASHLVAPEFAFEALMHDAHEAYVGDVASPLKMLLPVYKALEKRVEAAVRKHFGLAERMPSEVKRADLQMLRWEQRDLMARTSEPEHWTFPERIEAPPRKLYPWMHHTASQAFLRRFHELKPSHSYIL